MASVLLISACGYTQHISGNGNIKSATRQVSNFTRLDCSGTFHVFLTQENNASLKIEADKNLLPYIISNVQGGKLVLKTKDDINLEPTQPINVYLVMKNIETLRVSHFCRLQNQDTLQANDLELSVSGAAGMNLQLKTQSLKSRISGSGKMNVKGNAASAEYHISGNAEVMASDLATNSVEARISGNGKLHVYAQKKLNVTISGNGEIWYKGTPQIKESISGSGKIVKE